MDVPTKRLLLFLGGCIVVRSLIAYAAYKAPEAYLPYMGALALIPAFGFLYIYLISPRDTGPEVFGGKIWWNSLRPVHAILYILFAIYAFRGRRDVAYRFLALDVVIGLLAFIICRSRNAI